MAYSGLGSGTIGDPYQVTTFAQVKEMDASNNCYWKQTNNIDCSSAATYIDGFVVNNFQGNYDGSSYELYNITTGIGYAFGFDIQNGCTVKNLTFRISKSVFNNENDKERTVLGKVGYVSRSDVSLNNLKIITSGNGGLHWLSDATFTSSCTIKNIVLEGNINQVFPNYGGAIACTLEGIKVLKTGSYVNYTHTPIVGLSLSGEMKYCQQIILNQTITTPNTATAFLVGDMQSGSKITESFGYGNLTVAWASLGAQQAHGLVNSAGASAADGTEIKDCYFRGYLKANGGENTNITDPNYGKSGMGITGNYNAKITRCLVNAQIDTSLNNGTSRAIICTSTNNRDSL